MDMKLESYKDELRQTAYYKDFYSVIVEDFRNLMASTPDKAKEFAIRIIAEKSKLNETFTGELLNYYNDAELEAKMQIDAEALAILDVDFSNLLSMQKVGLTTLRLNNIKAMLKNQATIVEPAQTSIFDFDGNNNASVEANVDFADEEEVNKKNKLTATYRKAPHFARTEREQKVKSLRKMLIKDVAEQLYRTHFELFVKTNEKANKVFSADKLNVNQVKISLDYEVLQAMMLKKEAVQNLLSIFGALSSSKTTPKATFAMVKLNGTARDVENKLNNKPTIAEIDVLVAQKILKEIDSVIDEAITASENNLEIFKNAKTPTRFMNLWHKHFNCKGVEIDNSCRDFGTSINKYVDGYVNKLTQYADIYETPKRAILQDEFGLN